MSFVKKAALSVVGFCRRAFVAVFSDGDFSTGNRSNYRDRWPGEPLHR